MKLLVTGANGQLGNELRELLCHSRENGNPVKDTLAVKNLDPRRSLSRVSPRDQDDKAGRGNDNVLFVDRDELDITDGMAVDAYITKHKPDYCINAAAYTNVEIAEDENEYAYAVNALGAENIARSCTQHNVILFHISTDFVFDGEKNVPYAEDDEPNPLGAYARTKYEGERAVQEHCPRSFIVRTSWLYSSFGHNFVKSILRRCTEMAEMGSGTNSLGKLSQTPFLPVVADQYGSPTYARDLAEVLLKMIEVLEKRRHPERSVAESKDPEGSENIGISRQARNDELFGVYHYANDGEVTWFEFAQKIRDVTGLSCDLKPIPASDFPSKVTRPTYSVLSTKKIQHVFGARVPEWDESLKQCIKDAEGLV